ncbi:ISAzo13-like element transposase-related protein [Trichormus azollae]|uniref:ISAzo13-like element transposase-related protein n=1 Tax=Trichormus azollae TaxID=1164 RepID=UPI00325E7A14
MLERHTACSPMDGTVKWTHLKGHEIARLLGHEGIEVSVTVVEQLLKKHNFPKPKAVKTLATGETEHRNQQFEAIDQL